MTSSRRSMPQRAPLTPPEPILSATGTMSFGRLISTLSGAALIQGAISRSSQHRGRDQRVGNYWNNYWRDDRNDRFYGQSRYDDAVYSDYGDYDYDYDYDQYDNDYGAYNGYDDYYYGDYYDGDYYAHRGSMRAYYDEGGDAEASSKAAKGAKEAKSTEETKPKESKSAEDSKSEKAAEAPKESKPKEAPKEPKPKDAEKESNAKNSGKEAEDKKEEKEKKEEDKEPAKKSESSDDTAREEMMEMLRGIKQQNLNLRKEISVLRKHMGDLKDHAANSGTPETETEAEPEIPVNPECPLSGENVPASQCCANPACSCHITGHGGDGTQFYCKEGQLMHLVVKKEVKATMNWMCRPCE